MPSLGLNSRLSLLFLPLILTRSQTVELSSTHALQCFGDYLSYVHINSYALSKIVNSRWENELSSTVVPMFERELSRAQLKEFELSGANSRCRSSSWLLTLVRSNTLSSTLVASQTVWTLGHLNQFSCPLKEFKL